MLKMNGDSYGQFIGQRLGGEFDQPRQLGARMMTCKAVFGVVSGAEG